MTCRRGSSFRFCCLALIRGISRSLGQAMEVIEGSSEENGQVCSASPDSPAVKVLMQAWKEVNDVQRKMLASITLADLLERAKEQDEQMYHI